MSIINDVRIPLRAVGDGSMLNNAYYNSLIIDFINTDENQILGQLTQAHGFSLEMQQRNAWLEQIKILQQELAWLDRGQVFFEFNIPRMGKRVDTVLLIDGLVFVVEFKVGGNNFESADIRQVEDYTLDLKNFHRGSHNRSLVPVLIATEADEQNIGSISWASDNVANHVCIAGHQLGNLIKATIPSQPKDVQNANDLDWANSGYQPTPTIIEAARVLYQTHSVEDITRSDAGASNLAVTDQTISKIISESKRTNSKSICFITGVPGSGKTLAGLNIATQRVERQEDEQAVFLSGNGPLVQVLREALARDLNEREKVTKSEARRRVASFIQPIHHFRDAALSNKDPVHEHIVVFDEAQRAWSRAKIEGWMRQKRGIANFSQSEPEFLTGVMDRHYDWCVIVCLIGGGQEINTGEAGIGEWFDSIKKSYPHWNVYTSDRLDDADYLWDLTLASALKALPVKKHEELHLSVSLRSFRAEAVSDFANQIIQNCPEKAKEISSEISANYPIFLTRDLSRAREWVREKARGNEKYGIIASSNARRLRPYGINVKSVIDPTIWFLNEPSDVNSSFYLEEVATEFEVQGLELDWCVVCWDADYRYRAFSNNTEVESTDRKAQGEFEHWKFSGTKWQTVKNIERQLYLRNAYRVLLTRARQGMVIYVPNGDQNDQTRLPEFYEPIANHLIDCGVRLIS